MYNETALILIEIHKAITSSCKIDFTGKDFIQKYQIEHIILENLHQPTISNGPRRCSGCHNESGIAITISTPSGERYDLIYTSPRENTHDAHSLTILYHSPKPSFICYEIYHRTPKQEPNSGWLKHSNSDTTITDKFLSTLNTLAS